MIDPRTIRGLFSAPALLTPIPAFAADTAQPVTDLVAPGVDTGSLLQLLFSLIAVVCLILVSAWLLRRFGRIGGYSSSLKVVGGLSLGSRERVVLVQVGDTQVLLGVAPGRVQSLHVLDEPLADPEPSGNGAQGQGFADRLQVALQRGKS